MAASLFRRNGINSSSSFSEVRHLKQVCESLCEAELSEETGSVAGSFLVEML